MKSKERTNSSKNNENIEEEFSRKLLKLISSCYESQSDFQFQINNVNNKNNIPFESPVIDLKLEKQQKAMIEQINQLNENYSEKAEKISNMLSQAKDEDISDVFDLKRVTANETPRTKQKKCYNFAKKTPRSLNIQQVEKEYRQKLAESERTGRENCLKRIAKLQNSPNILKSPKSKTPQKKNVQSTPRKPFQTPSSSKQRFYYY